jgi:hypothetical protein
MKLSSLLVAAACFPALAIVSATCEAASCVDAANNSSLVVSNIASFIRDCESRAVAECARAGAPGDKTQTNASCVSRLVGNKGLLVVQFQATCYSQAKARKIAPLDLRSFLSACQAQALAPCTRAADDLGLSTGQARQFTRSCQAAALGDR